MTAQTDIAAIEALLEEYQPRLTRFAQRHCATPQDVEDAVQETLWIASRKIGSLRVPAALASWLFKIVRNYCYRLLKIGRNDSPLDALPDQMDTQDSPEGQMILKRDVAQALAALPRVYREVVIMRDIQELTAPETAALLGVTVEAVKARLHRGRTLLREALGAWAREE